MILFTTAPASRSHLHGSVLQLARRHLPQCLTALNYALNSSGPLLLVCCVLQQLQSWEALGVGPFLELMSEFSFVFAHPAILQSWVSRLPSHAVHFTYSLWFYGRSMVRGCCVNQLWAIQREILTNTSVSFLTVETCLPLFDHMFG